MIGRSLWSTEPWSLIERLLFRFCFVYFGLFCLATQVAGSLLPPFGFRGLGPLWPMRQVTVWFAQRALGVTSTPVHIDPKAVGETAYFLAQCCWMLVVAVLVAAVWSAVDRRRSGHPGHLGLLRGFLLFVRLGLAAQMFEYGLTKVIPNQFIAPSLTTLVTPAGNLSLNDLLWTSVGAAPGYQMFTGWAELLAGILLLIPHTATAGALLCLADLAQVFVLNMTYDVGLKLTSLHLILLTLLFLAPEAGRLMNFFLGRSVAVSSGAGGGRKALFAQIVFGVYLAGMYGYLNWGYWNAVGGGSPRSPLYGIWDVEELSVDGETRPAVLHDYDRRWRRVIFDAPGRLTFQRTDDSLAHFSAAVDMDGKTITLTRPAGGSWRAAFAFERPSEDRLVLDGEMEGLKVHLELQLLEFDTLRLLNSHFRWIRPAVP